MKDLEATKKSEEYFIKKKDISGSYLKKITLEEPSSSETHKPKYFKSKFKAGTMMKYNA